MNPKIHAGLIALRNLAIGGNLASLSLLSDPRKMVLYVTDNLFSLRSIADSRGIPQKNVFEIFSEARSASVSLANRNGDTWFIERPSFGLDIIALCLLCRALKPRKILEIGTYKGYSALHMALNSEAEVYTLDLGPTDKPTLDISVTDTGLAAISKQVMAWDGTPERDRIHQLYGDSARFDFSTYHGQMDLCFIDGAHSYEYVKSDTLNALKCCKPGAVLAWHDFGRVSLNGVSKWLLEFSKQHKVYSVPGGSLAFSGPLSRG
jgi:hypothetical protein